MEHHGCFDFLRSTASVNENLKNATDLVTFLQQNKADMIHQTFAGHLKMLLEQKGLRRADVIRDSGLDEAYVYQLFKGEKRPSRDKLIALAFGLHLDEEETQRMLKLGGYSELYSRLERDAVILFAILHEKSIDEVNDLLYDNGFLLCFRQISKHFGINNNFVSLS